MDDLKTILERIKKPLAFAGRDGFAHVKSLAGREPFMRAQADDTKRAETSLTFSSGALIIGL